MKSNEQKAKILILLFAVIDICLLILNIILWRL